MKRKLLSLLAAILLLMILIPSAGMAEEPVLTYMYVRTDNGGPLNMRESDSSDSRVLTTIPYGTRLELMDYMMGAAWVYCDYDGFYGYVMTRYLAYDKPHPKPRPTERPTPRPLPPVTPRPGPQPVPVPAESMFDNFAPVYFNAVVRPSTPSAFVHMRWAPSKAQPILSDYYQGQALQVLYANDAWCQVYDPATHISGFMMREYLTFIDPIDYSGGLGAQEDTVRD